MLPSNAEPHDDPTALHPARPNRRPPSAYRARCSLASVAVASVSSQARKSVTAADVKKFEKFQASMKAR